MSSDSERSDETPGAAGAAGGPRAAKWEEGETLYDGRSEDLSAAVAAAAAAAAPAAPPLVVVATTSRSGGPGSLASAGSDEWSGHGGARMDTVMGTGSESGAHFAVTRPGEPPDRPTVLLDTVPARPVDRVAPGPAWAAGYEATQNVRIIDASQGPDVEPGAVSRGFVITAATACFAILVGVIVGMLVLKVLARDEAPSLALEHAQQLEQLLVEGEAQVAQGRCDEARRRADAVLLLAPDSARAGRLRQRAQACGQP